MSKQIASYKMENFIKGKRYNSNVEWEDVQTLDVIIDSSDSPLNGLEIKEMLDDPDYNINDCVILYIGIAPPLLTFYGKKFPSTSFPNFPRYQYQMFSGGIYFVPDKESEIRILEMTKEEIYRKTSKRFKSERD